MDDTASGSKAVADPAHRRRIGSSRWMARQRDFYRRGGRATAHHLYGAIIVLAVLVTAGDHTAHPLEVAVVLALTVAVLLGMEAYAEAIGHEIELRRLLTHAERRAALRELTVVTASAEIPLVFLLLAGLGVLSTSSAFFLAKGATLALLYFYGYTARRQAGRGRREAVVAGLIVAGIGLALALGKGYIHL